MAPLSNSAAGKKRVMTIGSEQYIQCEKCHSHLPLDATFCGYCGYPLALDTSNADRTLCSSCRKWILAGSVFCGYCGVAGASSQPFLEHPSSCKYCGKQVLANALYCGYCGTQLSEVGPFAVKSGSESVAVGCAPEVDNVRLPIPALRATPGLKRLTLSHSALLAAIGAGVLILGLVAWFTVHKQEVKIQHEQRSTDTAQTHHEQQADTADYYYQHGVELQSRPVLVSNHTNLDDAKTAFETVVAKFPESNLVDSAKQRLAEVNAAIAENEASQSNGNETPTASTFESERSVRDAVAAWEQAFRSKDATAMADCYAPLVETYFLRHNVTRDQIQRYVESAFTRTLDISKYEISDIQVEMIPAGQQAADSVIYSRATAVFHKEWETADSSGKTFSGEELEKLTFDRSPEGWKIVREEEIKILRASKR